VKKFSWLELNEPSPLLGISSFSGKNGRWLRVFLRGKRRLYVRSSIPLSFWTSRFRF